jgi:hypothetical protein
MATSLAVGGERMVGYAMNKKDLQDRLRRIEGQVRGLNGWWRRTPTASTS